MLHPKTLYYLNMATFIFRFVLIAFMVSSAALFTTSRAADPSKDGEHEYNYEDGHAKGPKNWGSIKPEWKVCNTGKLQSPIDLTNKRVTVLPGTQAVQTQYKPGPATIMSRGHDVAVEWKAGSAGGMMLNGTHYGLVQIHWHSPSEHTVNGKSYALEGHLVHKSANSALAVIGVLYNIGNASPFLDKVLSKGKITEKATDVGIVHPDEINFDKEQYYRYLGSLTTPPCTEGVIWTVVKKVDTISNEQLKVLKEAVHKDFKEDNARPIQD